MGFVAAIDLTDPMQLLIAGVMAMVSVVGVLWIVLKTMATIILRQCEDRIEDAGEREKALAVVIDRKDAALDQLNAETRRVLTSVSVSIDGLEKQVEQSNRNTRALTIVFARRVKQVARENGEDVSELDAVLLGGGE